AEGEKWKEIPAHPFRQGRLKEYVQKFGKDWVVQRTDSAGKISVRLKTLAEYRPLFEEAGKFLVMQAEEITDAYKGKPLHIGAVNVKELIGPKGGGSVTEVMQNNLDAVWEQRRRTGQPMFPHINHPNFGWAVALEDMIPLRGERFFEVYNGHPHVHNYGDQAHMGMEELWDKLQTIYLKAGKPVLYGLATDDSHHYLEYGAGMSNPGRGWIMVRAGELTPAALIDALERGAFYSTTGVELVDVKTEKGTLEVTVRDRPGTTYRIQFWGSSGSRTGGRILKEVKGTKASYTLKKGDLFVRAKIISSRLQQNPFQQGDYETAWTQPVTSGSVVAR
ncbi:MAG TPA: hypothetical protein VM871_07840, partial [Flavisolibacter sp.]|nr:hypothetical protein [Flavisolibacter sp.]